MSNDPVFHYILHLFYNPNEQELQDRYLIETEGINTDSPYVLYKYKKNISYEHLRTIHPNWPKSKYFKVITNEDDITMKVDKWVVI